MPPPARNGPSRRIVRELARLVLIVVAIGAGGLARAEALRELVAREEGVAFGPCALRPRPKIAGDAIHVVIPARFDSPGIWVTRTILLVGLDGAEVVQSVLELKLVRAVPPREVVGVTCKGRRLGIRLSPKAPGRRIHLERRGFAAAANTLRNAPRPSTKTDSGHSTGAGIRPTGAPSSIRHLPQGYSAAGAALRVLRVGDEKRVGGGRAFRADDVA